MMDDTFEQICVMWYDRTEGVWATGALREEVVRCRDCAHLVCVEGHPDLCVLHSGVGYFKVRPNGFCAWGRRQMATRTDTNLARPESSVTYTKGDRWWLSRRDPEGNESYPRTIDVGELDSPVSYVPKARLEEAEQLVDDMLGYMGSHTGDGAFPPIGLRDLSEFHIRSVTIFAPKD